MTVVGLTQTKNDVIRARNAIIAIRNATENDETLRDRLVEITQSPNLNGDLVNAIRHLGAYADRMQKAIDSTSVKWDD